MRVMTLAVAGSALAESVQAGKGCVKEGKKPRAERTEPSASRRELGEKREFGSGRWEGGPDDP